MDVDPFVGVFRFEENESSILGARYVRGHMTIATMYDDLFFDL